MSLANQAAAWAGAGMTSWLQLTPVDSCWLTFKASISVSWPVVHFFHIGVSESTFNTCWNMIGQLGMATRDTEWIGEQELKLRESSHISGALHAALQGHFEDGFTGHSRRGHPVTFAYWACELSCRYGFALKFETTLNFDNFCLKQRSVNTQSGSIWTVHDFDLEPSKNLREIMLAQKLYSTQHHRLHCVRQPLPSDPSVRKLLGFQRDAHTPAEAASEMSQLGNDMEWLGQLRFAWQE